jgi:hypothetical protein
MDFAQAPLYVRWNAERLPFAVEIRLDVIGRMARAIESSQATGIEIGGTLIGTHPTPSTPTFRIEDFQLTPRRIEDGPIFMLDPREHDRFATARWEDRGDGRTTVGFFRSHRRPGALRPSLADRTLLSSEFAGQTYAALLVESGAPFTAALFIASRGELPDEPSVGEFQLDEQAFGSLPEMPPPSAPGVQVHVPRSFPIWRYALGTLAVLALLLFGGYFWTVRSDSTKGIDLAVAGDRVLSISWNHALPEMQKASSAKLIISDGAAHREVTLSPDELLAGTVAYRRTTREVQVTLILQMPGAVSLIQSSSWQS